MEMGRAKCLLVIGTVLSCALHYNMVRTADVSVMKSSHSVGITCIPSSNLDPLDTIESIKITKKTGTIFQYDSIAFAEKNAELVFVTETLRGKFEATASIGFAGNSVLFLNLLHPKKEDRGTYTCDVYYKNGKGLQVDAGAAYLDLKDSPVSKTKCEPGWTKYMEGDACVQVSFQSKNWDDANSDCRQMGGDLMQIEDQNKQDFFNRLYEGRYKVVWIGLKRADINRQQFSWVNGHALNYSNWARGEPNDIDYNEECTLAEPPNNKWYDHDCGNPHRFVCEKPAMSVIADKSNCAEGWTEYREGKTCLQEVEKFKKTWRVAKMYCQSLGGELVRVGGRNKQNFLANFITKSSTPKWIGLRKWKGEFVWWNDSTLDQKQTTFTYWQSGEPGQSTNNEGCVSTGQSTDRWRNASCDKKYGFICERPSN